MCPRAMATGVRQAPSSMRSVTCSAKRNALDAFAGRFSLSSSCACAMCMSSCSRRPVPFGRPAQRARCESQLGFRVIAPARPAWRASSARSPGVLRRAGSTTRARLGAMRPARAHVRCDLSRGTPEADALPAWGLSGRVRRARSRSRRLRTAPRPRRRGGRAVGSRRPPLRRRSPEAKSKGRCASIPAYRPRAAALGRKGAAGGPPWRKPCSGAARRRQRTAQPRHHPPRGKSTPAEGRWAVRKHAAP